MQEFEYGLAGGCEGMLAQAANKQAMGKDFLGLTICRNLHVDGFPFTVMKAWQS